MYNATKLENFRGFSAQIEAETRKENPDMRLIRVWLKVLSRNHESLYSDYTEARNIAFWQSLENDA